MRSTGPGSAPATASAAAPIPSAAALNGEIDAEGANEVVNRLNGESSVVGLHDDFVRVHAVLDAYLALAALIVRAGLVSGDLAIAMLSAASLVVGAGSQWRFAVRAYRLGGAGVGHAFLHERGFCRTG